MTAMKVELFEKEKEKKKGQKMEREREKASIEYEEAKIQILKVEESVETTIGMLEKNYERLASMPYDPTLWEERCSLVGDYMSNWKKKLDLVRDFAEEHFVNNDLFWTSRFNLLGKIGSEVANKEFECTKRFLSKGTNNYQAWSYREWIIRNINKCLWKSELQYCHEILKEDKFNVPVWIQICHAARQLNHKMGEKLRLKEAFCAKEAIIAHPGNEGPWTYLKVLYAEHKETLYTNPDLECIFVDVLAEAADRVKLARTLDPCCSAAYSSVAHRGCAHAMNLIVDLMINGYEMYQNIRLVNAVNVLFAYPYQLCRIYDAMLSVDACRVRYCHKYRGFHWFRVLSQNCNRGLQFEMEAQDDTFCNDGHDLSLVEKFGALLKHTVFENHTDWKDCLFEIYFKKQSRPDNEAFEEDLKCDIGRCVLKDESTKDVDAAGKELHKTTNMIKLDGYNRRAWLHRQWVFQTFGGDWKDDDEMKLCDEILEKDACNSFAWDHRFFLIKRLVQKLDWNDDEEIKCFNVQYQEVLQREVNYAIRFILVEPGNSLPWGHISGVYTAYPVSQLVGRDKVREAILQVLKNNKDGIMSEQNFMVNAGIINAMNMLLDHVLKNKYDIWKDEELRCIMNQLCPDSCFEHDYQYDTLDKVLFVLQRMVNAFSEDDLSWENVADQLLAGP